MLRITRAEARPLPFDIVEVLVTNGEIVVSRELIYQIVDDCPFRRKAGHFVIVVAIRAIAVRFDQIGAYRIVYVRRMFLVLVPGFSGGVPVRLRAELVIPRQIVSRKIVVGVVTVVQRIVTQIYLIESGAPGVRTASVEG